MKGTPSCITVTYCGVMGPRVYWSVLVVQEKAASWINVTYGVFGAFSYIEVTFSGVSGRWCICLSHSDERDRWLYQ